MYAALSFSYFTNARQQSRVSVPGLRPSPLATALRVPTQGGAGDLIVALTYLRAVHNFHIGCISLSVQSYENTRDF